VNLTSYNAFKVPVEFNLHILISKQTKILKRQLYYIDIHNFIYLYQV